MNQKDFDQFVKKFKNTKDKTGTPLNMHYLMVKKNNLVYSHTFKKERSPSDVRSISKTVLTMIAGIVMDLSKQGEYPEFSAETDVYPILRNIVNLTNDKNKDKLSKLKVKHLLNHTVGFDKVLMMRDDIVDVDPFTYLDAIVNEPIAHEPGTYYLYSNAGFYLLSAVLQEFLEEDLLEFAQRHLFNPLKIENFRWEKYGDYLAGATRLFLLPEDLLKIGDVLLNKGMYQEIKILSENEIDRMIIPTQRTQSVDTPDAVYRRYAYGSGIWLAQESIYFGHGTAGQCLVMVPEKNAIILTLAEQNHVSELEKLVNEMISDFL